jgi:hypothetical protein
MADKDLLTIMADMLRKMDQHEEILDVHTKLLEKQGETLATFMDVSIKHFEKQQDFNERFLASSQQIAQRLDRVEATLSKILDLETRLKRLEEAVFK